MRKLLLLGLLPSCMLATQPVDLLPRGAYCEPLSPDEYVCREPRPIRHCVFRHGRWSCWRAE